MVKAISEKSLDESMDAGNESTPQKADNPSSVVGDEGTESATKEPADKESGKTPAAEPVKAAESAKKVEVINMDDPEVESIAELEGKHSEDSPAPSPAPKRTETDSESKKELIKKLSPKKTLKEIEEEVARNTAKYDEDTLKGEKVEGKGGMKRGKVSKETVMKSKAAGAATNNIQPTNVTRLVRMLVIILLGAYKGMLCVLVTHYLLRTKCAPSLCLH
jgi:hypothetical protein